MIFKSIKEEKKSYLTNLFKGQGEMREKIYTKVFGTSKPKFSYTHEVIVIHTTLLTRRMYQIDPPEFVATSKSGEDFYEFVLSSITPDM